MIRTLTMLTALVAVLALPSRLLAQETGDAMQGEIVAKSVCAQCHAVRQAQFRSPNPMAPNFTAIATTLGMTRTALRVWLQSSHPTMPNYILPANEREDVVAYILSLKSSRGQQSGR